MSNPSEKTLTPAQIIEVARDVLHAEARSVAAVAERLDSRFAAAIALVLESHGRIIVSGMGKSGLIGRKIASTFSSTGTPSFFLHPAEALHGDLGMVRAEDVMLLLSNSGETEEIIRLIPYLRRIGSRVVAITGRLESNLGRAADVTLDAAIDREACPLNLAPTSSTTVALALGDALAVALSTARGFKERDFARLHPSGSLGQRFIKVRDLMHAGDELPLVRDQVPLQEALTVMSAKRFGTLFVTDGAQHLLGLVSDGDLRRYLQKAGGNIGVAVGTMMTRTPTRIASSQLAMAALKIMEEKSITVLPVVDDDRVVGLLHLHDILRSRVV